MRFQSIRKRFVPLLPFYAVGFFIACALKLFYSHAGADDLNWILAPTIWLVELLSGISFERELHTGWISHSHRMIVGPSCAGVNFLIIAFSTFFFTFVHRYRRFAQRNAWLGGSLGFAFLLTIAANAVRIMVAVCLFQVDIYGGAITPERVHRIEGVAVYSVSLLLAYLALERSGWWPEESRNNQWLGSPLVPLGWYLAIVVGVPLLNRSYRPEPVRFLEHTGLVVAVCMVVALLGILLGSVSRRFRPGAAVRSR